MEQKDESYNTLKEMSQDLANSKRDQINEMVNDILERYEEVKEANTTIPENVFKHYFLPFFKDLAKSVKPEDSKQNKNLMSAWINLANGPFNEVDVIDDVKGETLFTVPSLFVKNAVVLENVKDFNFSEVGSAYKMKASVNPFQAENYVNSALAAVPKFIKDPKANVTDEERWIKIFKRYSDTKNKKEDLITKPINSDTKQVKRKIKEDLGVDLDND